MSETFCHLTCFLQAQFIELGQHHYKRTRKRERSLSSKMVFCWHYMRRMLPSALFVLRFDSWVGEVFLLQENLGENRGYANEKMTVGLGMGTCTLM